MGFIWSEPPAGPRTTPRARVALAGVHEGLRTSRAELLAAGDVPWVSVAADRYRALLTDALGDVARLTFAQWSTGGPVLRHTAAADTAREGVEEATMGSRMIATWELPFP